MKEEERVNGGEERWGEGIVEGDEKGGGGVGGEEAGNRTRRIMMCNTRVGEQEIR